MIFFLLFCSVDDFIHYEIKYKGNPIDWLRFLPRSIYQQNPVLDVTSSWLTPSDPNEGSRVPLWCLATNWQERRAGAAWSAPRWALLGFATNLIQSQSRPGWHSTSLHQPFVLLYSQSNPTLCQVVWLSWLSSNKEPDGTLRDISWYSLQLRSLARSA